MQCKVRLGARIAHAIAIVPHAVVIYKYKLVQVTVSTFYYSSA